MNEPNYATRIALDLETFIDFEAAHAKVAEVYWGKGTDRKIPFEQWSSIFFSNLPPRTGVMGFIWDRRSEGATVEVFTNHSSDVLKTRAELWLRSWLNDNQFQLHFSSEPMLLEQQVYIFAEGHTYGLLGGFDRIIGVPRSGDWPLDKIEKICDLNKRAPELKVKSAS